LIRLLVDELDGWTCRLLEAAGLPEGQAAMAARVFTDASLRGVGHHDISFLPQRLDWLERYGVNPRPDVHLVRSFGGTEVWEGDRGLGEVCCSVITDRAMILAAEFGIGYAVVRNSNHFLAASPYVERCAANGFLGMVFSSTDAGMSVPGGTTLGIGNNPFGFALPQVGYPTLMADLCMAYSSLGNLKALAATGQSVPEYWGNDRTGRPTTDPAAILDGGATHPMGNHKGFALALLVESLTGVMAGGPTGDQIAPGGGINTHNQAVIAINLAAFGGIEAIGDRSRDLADRLKARNPGLRLPGERSHASAQRCEAEGVPIDPALWEKLTGWSRQLGVTPPEARP
jgi:LDH2 family malate/lactate/ureidoglycolate dehydrogenase